NLYRYRITGLITQDENQEDFLTFGNNAQVAIVGGSLGLEGQLAAAWSGNSASRATCRAPTGRRAT
ncbi:MAG: hypothetical protein IPM02_24515, partial [Betaproteobacteria bacterium]|nr:hypothetical protein [Betaproteobacteria bacterium]